MDGLVAPGGTENVGAGEATGCEDLVRLIWSNVPDSSSDELTSWRSVPAQLNERMLRFFLGYLSWRFYRIHLAGKGESSDQARSGGVHSHVFPSTSYTSCMI